MLQRNIAESLRQTCRGVPNLTTRICLICTCRCGAQFPHNGQYRSYATKRRAPSTVRKEARSEAISLTPEEARLWQQAQKANQRELFDVLAWCRRNEYFSADPNRTLDFLNDFEPLVTKYRGRPTVGPAELTKLQEQYQLNNDNAIVLSRILLRNRNPETRFRGKKLMLSLSRAGSVEASVFVVAQAHTQARQKPSILKSSEISYSRAHLTQVANEGQHHRAMVLEGKVALALGDSPRAISLWNRAMDAAVAAGEENDRRRKEGRRLPKHLEVVASDVLELSSPWIELMLVHYKQHLAGDVSAMEKCRRAMDIGCKQDDPTSHYYAASFTKRVNDQGNHIATSDWLYHTLKAASSGHQKACHELAVFYAQSGWKYIDDEPPEHVKPTPFDSYPASTPRKSIWTKIQETFGIKTAAETDPKDSVFQSAVFPYTAADRFKLALKWLDIPIHHHYAPSHLFKAKMLMQETLWGNANAPLSALQLRSERYIYASKEEHDRGNSLDHVPSMGDIPDPPNPFYNLAAARDSLREVFYAYEANKHVQGAQEQYQADRVLGRQAAAANEDKVIEQYGARLPLRLRKWLLYSEVREMYEDELDGLYDEAKQICDEQGWDMYDDEGGLLYKAEIKGRLDAADIGVNAL